MREDCTPERLLRRAEGLAATGSRRILGIVGLPGSGKSTLAQDLVGRLGTLASLVPMDGFHLSNAELDRLGRRDRKGAPDTFDVAGYLDLLRRLRTNDEETVGAPSFSRTLDEPVAAAIVVHRATPLVITEGNYLLVREGPWARVSGLLDEVWFVERDEDTRLEQLVQRHIQFGKTPEAGRAWAQGSDQRNADVVVTTRGYADLVIRLGA